MLYYFINCVLAFAIFGQCVRSTVSVFMLPSLVVVITLTLWRPGWADVLPVLEFAMCEA